MKRLAFLGLLFVAPCAHAQSGTNVPPGQSPTASGIVQSFFTANSDPTGFGEHSLTPAGVASGTTQLTATVIVARTTVITSCPSGAGFILPALNSYTPVVIANRSGAACNVFPTVGATVETAPGTAGAANAAYAQPNNSDVTYKPQSATAWLQ